jgi:hypothetical protein
MANHHGAIEYSDRLPSYLHDALSPVTVMAVMMEIPGEDGWGGNCGQSGGGDQDSYEAFHCCCSFRFLRPDATDKVAGAKRDLLKVTRGHDAVPEYQKYDARGQKNQIPEQKQPRIILINMMDL